MTTDRKPVARRMAVPGSAQWHVILDGVEAILREEGFASLTSRQVAERVGMKQRLVYYYFETMDDLIVAAFRRSSDREYQRLNDAIVSEFPLREVWDICIHTADARMTSEYMALANRIEALRTEVVVFIEESRRLQVEALTRAAERMKRPGALPPAAIAVIASSLGLALTREMQIGVRTGHAEALAVVEAFLIAAEGS